MPERRDGFAPLGDYAATGDGRSVALIALDGSVDWWALPNLDAEPAFAALLDPEGGGRVELSPEGEFSAEHRYIDHTNVVETIFRTDTGAVRVTDSLNSGVAGRLPWAELARRVDGLSGSVAMRWRVAPGTALGVYSPWVAQDGLLHLDDLTIGVRADGLGTLAGEAELSGSFRATEGSHSLLAVVATHREPLRVPSEQDIDGRIDRTIAAWRDWSDAFRWDGPWEEQVRRSALSLKLLLFSPAGSIAAAATTALPERIGGAKNWDYRYTWVRDTAYTLDAFVRCGLMEELQASVAWLLNAVERNGPELWPFYTLGGGRPSGSHRRDVPGYRNSGPVDAGNRAAGQLQLGPYGDLFQTVFLCVQQGHHLDQRTGRLLADLADRCCDQWQQRDAGMWELPEMQHYTLSKISCWQALDRAARLAASGQLPGNERRWRWEAAKVRSWVDENCWSEERRAYTFYAGADQLDAGVLLAARFGFDRSTRMSSTIDAVRAELGTGPLLHRYSGMAKEEGAFLACSFWAVEALAFTGRAAEATDLMDATLDRTREFLLLGEMIDPGTGEMLGNLPQALSLLALINAASAVAEVSTGR
jgi:GH15 family glucan-1,4-alpha-glucosidase